MDLYKEENQFKDFKVLSKLIEDHLKYSETDLNFQKFTDAILKISEAKFAAFNLYDEDGKHFTTTSISGESKIIKKATSFLGMNIVGKKWEHDLTRAERIKNQSITRFKNLNILASDKISKQLINKFINKFNIGEVILVKITKDDKMLGDFTLLMSKGKFFNKDNIAGMFSNHIGLLIEKTRSEEKAKKLDKAYNKQSEILETITENIIDPVALTDAEGNFTYVGKSHSILGYDLDFLIGKNVMEFIHPEDFSYIKKRFSEFVENKLSSQKVEYRIRCKDGSYLWWETIGNLLIENNKIKGIVFSSRDITERKKLQESLKVSEERFRKLFHEVSSVAIQGLNPDGKIIFWNKASADLYGYTEEEALSQNLIDLIIPENTKSYVKSSIKRMFELGVPNNPTEELSLRHKDGTLIPIYSNHVVVNMDSGQSQLFSLDIDMRQQKAAERQLYIEKELLKTTILSVGDGVISTDFQGNIVMLNRVSEELTGWNQEDAVGKSLEEVFHIVNEYTREKISNPVDKVLKTGKTIELESNTILISKNGTEIPIEDSAAPIIDDKGDISGVVLVFRDFTERKKHREKIEKLSFQDHLTGLYNRRYFEIELKRLDIKRNLPLIIIMGDVNGLKLINDSFGHSIGDNLLVSAAEILKKSCRENDIISRIGGDEYAILMTQANVADAESIIRRIKENSKGVRIKGIEISISFGYAVKEHMDERIDMIFKKAEDTMYKNKLFEGPSIRGRAIDNIVDAINSKSPREKEHSERVSKICVKIGEALELKEYMIKEIKVFGLFHDIGKIAISDNILNKPGPLDQGEFEEMKRHPEIGYRILSATSGMSKIADYVLAHHERYDGDGYPKGLKGKEIPLPSRICMIADAYDAMTSERSYRSSMSEKFALNQLKKHSGSQFDKELVKIFIEEVYPKI